MIVASSALMRWIKANSIASHDESMVKTRERQDFGAAFSDESVGAGGVYGSNVVRIGLY